MTFPILLTLIIIAVAVILFATEKLRVDIIALLVLLTVILTGLVTPQQGFSGFSNPAVITVWAVYIVSAGLFRTGIADMIGERILRLTGSSEPRMIAIIMITCGVMSAFMNNIGATAVLLPAVMSMARQTKVPASRLLIPLSFASLLGGNMTLIGTPPNVLAATILAERGLPSFGFFDYTPTGVLVFGIGVIYMVLIGRHLLPVRVPAEELSTRQLRAYLSEVRVNAASPLIGQSLAESGLGANYDLTVVGLVRDGQSRASLNRDTRFLAGDVLIVEGAADNLLRARDKLHLEAEAEREVFVGNIEPEKVTLVEATLAPRSGIAGRSLKQIRFRDRYRYSALAIWRKGEIITQRLSDEPLRFGDTLLLQGPRASLPALQAGTEFLILEQVKVETPLRGKAWVSLAILAMVLGLVTIGNFAISTAMVMGAVAMVLTGCLNMDEAYASIAWRSVFLIAGMLPLGLAMESTGTARYLADIILGLIGGLGPIAILAGIYLLGSLITEPMSNAAATVLMVPISIDIALGLGADPRAFVLATVIATSTSFLTPVGHQANLLVMGPGGYRFSDYARVGALLNVVIMVAAMLLVPLIWPLFP